PFRYNLRSVLVRGGATLLTVLSIAATVAVLAGVLCLRQGFLGVMTQRGRDDLAVFLRRGANSEGESGIDLERARILVKETPEIATGADGSPLAAAELFRAVSLDKISGGKTNVPIRGVQPASFLIHGDALHIVEGRRKAPGPDELVVGRALVDRMQNCRVGDRLVLNLTPFTIVGVFDADGSYRSEIWGDVDRLQQALQTPNYCRVVAVLKPGVAAAD